VSKRVLVASPRSFCAGVVRAIDIVEHLLERRGPPVYVRHEIVHNVHVVRDLESRGAVFVESEEDVPEGARERLKFVWLETVDDAAQYALDQAPSSKGAASEETSGGISRIA